MAGKKRIILYDQLSKVLQFKNLKAEIESLSWKFIEINKK